MRSSNKLNRQNGSKAISNLQNGLSWVTDLLAFRIEYKQLLAMWMICAMLLPVFAAPASAAANWSSPNATAATEEDYSQFEPVNGEQSVLKIAAMKLNLAIERFFAPSFKINNSGGNKTIVTADENPKEDNAPGATTEKSDKENTEENVENPIEKESKTNAENLTTEKPDSTDQKEIIEATSTESDSQNQSPALNNSAAPVQPMLLNQPLPEDERESVYTYDNNLGTPKGQTEADSSNQAAAIPIRHRPSIANFSFGLPLASLSGRGIDAGVGMTYNSRTWNKSQTFDQNTNQWVNHFTYDVEDSWIAPGFSTGLGYLESTAKVFYIHPEQSSNFQYQTEIVPNGITDADGGRHQMQCVAWTQISGSYTSRCNTYRSNDGTFIYVPAKGWTPNPNNSQTPNTTGYENVTFFAKYSNGMKVWYSGAFGSGTSRKHYPVIIEDSNGNRIRITYKSDLSGRIDYITDTINRKIKFYYENDTAGNPDKLVAVTIPGMNQGDELQTVRFYYDDNFALSPQTANGGFNSNSVVTAPAATRVLKYVYFPSTKSGFKYDYHPNYGMITKISRMVGMAVSNETSLTATGTVTGEGTWAATTEYNYPDGNTTINDVPKYSQRTDDWQGRTAANPQVTTYNETTSAQGEPVSQIIVQENGFNVITETVSATSGFLKSVSVKRNNGQTDVIMAKSEYTWSGRNLTKLVTTNENGLVKKTEFTYDGYDNQTKIKEYDYYTDEQNAVLLRTTDIGYETGTNWTNANLLGLVKSVKTTVGTTVVSKTLYEYDGNSLTRRSDMDTSTHSIFYNPDYPATQETICPTDDPDQQNALENGCVIITNPGYDGSTDYRGNVTKVGQMLDVNATTITETNSHKTDYYYDIAGNTVSATLSCCQLKTIEYGATFAETGYAYPTKEIRGTSPQLVNEAAYNKNTGLVTSTKDENGQITTYEYEADTLRQSKVTYPNGGYVLTEYSDKLAPGSVIGFIRTTTTLTAANTVQSYSYYDGRGLGIRSAAETTDGWSVSAVEYDSLGRPVKTYNPFYAATPNGAVPANTAFTQVSSYDALGRVPQVQLQDGTTVNSYFNEAAVTFTAPGNVSITGTASRAVDQAGKERRQIVDSLGRVVRVDEPTSAGLGSVSAPNQPTYYFYDGNDNLSKVIQSDGATTQERVFKYDSLSRLTHERQVEANPTLDDNGVKGTIDPNKWTKVLKYNADGLVAEGTDARGVKTTFGYDGLNRTQSVTFSDGTPAITYTYDQARTGFFNTGALTRVESADGGTVRPDTPATATEFDYDKMGRVVAHRQTIGSQTYNLEYGYNLAGQLISEKYPSGRTVSMNYDAKGRLSNIADAQRTYLSGLQFQGKGNSLSSMTYGNGTTQNFELNPRLQMVKQELKRGAEVLQKYDYGYGQINIENGEITDYSNNGQLAKIESTVGASKQFEQRFGYDSIGRLSESREYRGDSPTTLSYKQKFDYDNFGNLYRKNSSNPTTGQQTPISFAPIEDTDIDKTKNRLTSNTQYDDAGNVIVDTRYRFQNFFYDANGRMYKTSSTVSSNQSNAVYDASGMRVATQVDGVWTFFVYDIGGKKVAEYGGLSATDEGGVKYVLQDHQGSSRAIVNNAGYVNTRMDYTAFGEEIQSSIGQRTAQGYASSNTLNQKYALTERDKATGLDHTWFRKHENQAGRWTSPDPYNGSMNIGNPQSFNRYSYVENQPTNFVDPSGLQMMICRTYRRTWDDTDENGNPRANVKEWTECQIIGGGGSPGGIITPREPFEIGGGIGVESGQTNQRKGTECDRLAKDPNFRDFAENLWKKGGTHEAAGLFGFTIEPEDSEGLFKSRSIGKINPNTGDEDQIASGKWKKDTITADRNTIVYLYSAHTHPGGALFPSTEKTNGKGRGDAISLEQQQAIFRGDKLLGLIVTDGKFAIYNRLGKVICTGQFRR